jgi:hypothetical protein
MKKNQIIFILLLSIQFVVKYTNAQDKTIQMKSIVLKTSLDQNGNFSYQLNYKGKPILKNSKVGFELSKPTLLLNRFDLLGIDSSIFNQKWAPLWGEQDSIQNNYKEIIYHLSAKSDSKINIDMIFRVFEDGIGLRYEFPPQKGLEYFIVQNELTSFNLGKDHTAFWIPGDFDTNEYLYNTTKLSQIDAVKAAAKEKDIAVTAIVNDRTIQSPLMLKSNDGLYINIHEAALLNYPAMHLELNKNKFELTTLLVPDAVGNKAYLKAGDKTPWRTVIVSDKATDIIESKTIINLNDSSSLTDTEWIKPQKFMGVWWEMHINKADWKMSTGKHGATTDNVKRYIDFASKHNFDGVLVEGWNKGWEDWFGNWKEDVFDFVTPYNDYNIKELSNYAKNKGVKLIMHHETSGSVTNYERWMDSAYRFMIAHDINTVKTGYVGKIIPRGEHHDGQWMVNHYTRVAKKTSDYKIMVAAHEPVHPTGLHRSFPNWLANEAARGTEFNNAPTLGIPPEHNTILPFTRLMGGPMDYTPGLFHFDLNQFDSTRKQKVLSTLTKQLALYLIMYSPLQMAADLPENYEAHLDAFQFIKDVPVNWSETKVIEAEPGDYITIARRKKNEQDWYLGSITDEQSRQLNLKLDFLTKGKSYLATIYRDGKIASFDKNQTDYIIEEKIVSSKDLISIYIAKGGGCAISFKQITSQD